MTDKTYTAEQVEARQAFEDIAKSYGWSLEAAGPTYVSDETDLLWCGFRWGTAYAATLRQPSSRAGAVDEGYLDVLRRLRNALPTVGIKGWSNGVAALDAALSALARPASSEPASGEAVAYCVEKDGQTLILGNGRAIKPGDILYTHPADPVEMSPDFTDSARGAIAWVLYHHQGGSSAIGQPLRFALGMGAHEPLSDYRIAEAKRYAKWAGATTAAFQNAEPMKVAEGMVVVPKVLTDAMAFAWHNLPANCAGTSANRYRNMLAATPGADGEVA